MSNGGDFFEIDFLDVECDSSGDAITIRVVQNGVQTISIVDGGYSDCGTKIVEHVRKHYGNPPSIQNVILTHPDGDHAAGLKKVLTELTVERLWMNRPWLYAEFLIKYYPTYNNLDRLRARLKSQYPNVRDLEDIAVERGILIEEAFQGTRIGHFTVMSPTFEGFLGLVLRDDDRAEEPDGSVSDKIEKAWWSKVATGMRNLLAAIWGEENLPVKETTPRNEMSVVQYADLLGVKVLLTADAGHEAMSSFVDYAPSVGLVLPGIDRFQVPHHGSRRNVSSEMLDKVLGPKRTSSGEYNEFAAIISSAKKDVHHPKKAVVRAMIHRGGKVITTEGSDIRTGLNAPAREGWGPAEGYPYPTEQEE